MSEIHDASDLRSNGPTADGLQVKTIKRYTNRKLYDTVESRYVTLEEIAEMVRGGEEVRIIDNRTKEDLTSVTLAQIIFEQEKKTGRMPLSVLRDIVRNGGESLHGFIEKELSPRVASIREGAEHRFSRVFRKEGGDAFHTQQEAQRTLQDLLESFRHAVEEWQHRAHGARQGTDPTTGAVHKEAPGLQRDLHALRARLDELERKIADLDED